LAQPLAIHVAGDVAGDVHGCVTNRCAQVCDKRVAGGLSKRWRVGWPFACRGCVEEREVIEWGYKPRMDLGRRGRIQCFILTETPTPCQATSTPTASVALVSVSSTYTAQSSQAPMLNAPWRGRS